MVEFEALFNYLNDNHLTICCAESLTGGLFACELTKISGASKVFRGGIVAYQDEVKVKLLGISKDTIAKHGAVSSMTAYEMAKGAKEQFNADLAVSFTGNAGPNPSEGKEVGLVYMALINNHQSEIYQYHLKGSREIIQKECVKLIIEKIIAKK